jgi:hypothetical protein
LSEVNDQITQLQEEKANKSGLTLGVHTDGLVYIFIDGTPHGNGLEIKADVIEGDVFGYVDENNVIVLNGALADGTYTIKYEMDNGSTVDIGDLVLDSNVYYSVTNNLTNCTSNNSVIQAVQGGSYSATITANSGYELKSVTVTMGGSPVTVSGGTISIANVTGNIVITAVAEEIKVNYTNLADPTSADWATGTRFSSGGSVTTDSKAIATNYIPIKAGGIFYIKGLDVTSKLDSGSICRSVIYDTDKTVKRAVHASSTDSAAFTVDGNITTFDLSKLAGTYTSGFVRFGGELTGTANDVIITVDEPIV